MPHVVFDIDGTSFLETRKKTRFVIRRLVEVGCRPRDLISCYTGGQGFHVHLPSGALGNPLFRSAKAGHHLLKDLARRLDVFDVIDAGPLSPKRTIRLIGARHEDTGRYKLPIRLEDLASRSRRRRTWYHRAFRAHQPTELADPRSVPAVPNLVAMLRGAIRERQRQTHIFEDALQQARPAAKNIASDGLPAPLDRVADGLEESEMWKPDARVHGRNEGAFNLACYLMERSGLSRAETESFVRRVNRRHRPPLSEEELEWILESAAKRTP